MTPGDRIVKARMLLPAIGRDCIWAFWITEDTRASDSSTAAASALTVTAVVEVPTFSVTSTVLVWSKSRRTPVTSAVSNPAAATVTLKVAAGRFGNRYCPDEFVWAVAFTPVSTFNNVTVPDGTTARLGSKTVPSIWEVNCPHMRLEPNKATAKNFSATSRILMALFFMELPFQLPNLVNAFTQHPK